MEIYCEHYCSSTSKFVHSLCLLKLSTHCLLVLATRDVSVAVILYSFFSQMARNLMSNILVSLLFQKTVIKVEYSSFNTVVGEEL